MSTTHAPTSAIDELVANFPEIADIVPLISAQHGDPAATYRALCDMVSERPVPPPFRSTPTPPNRTLHLSPRPSTPIQASSASITELVSNFPHLADALARVSRAHAHDASATYAALCALASDPPTPAPASAPQPDDLAVLADLFAEQDVASDAAHARFLGAAEEKSAPAAMRAHGFGSAWGRMRAGEGDFAAREAVERILRRFPWADRSVVQSLYESTGECEEVTVEVLVERFPEVARIATEEGARAVVAETPRIVEDRPWEKIERTTAAAERARKRDVIEIAGGNGGKGRGGGELGDLRDALVAETKLRDEVARLYMSTQTNVNKRRSEESDKKVRALWKRMLAIMMADDSGEMDLHLLTVDQALEAVDAKVAQCRDGLRGRSKKVRLITGRGNNSSGRRAVLKPRVQAHLRQLGVSYTMDGTEGVVIAKIKPG